MAFICGCSHSGTSLVTAMLGAHPLVYAIPRETRVFRENDDSRSAYLLFQRDYLPAALEKGATVLCEKTPRHIRRLGLMRETFPDARIVVIVRDARDVAASIKERTGSVDEAIRRWNRDNGIARREIERGRKDLFVVAYEDLIAAPEKTLAVISTHVGIEYHPNMLEFHKDERDWFGSNPKTGSDGGFQGHGQLRNWQIHQPLMDRRGRWRTILSEAEARRVERQCRELMSFFGYLLPTCTSPATRLFGVAGRELKELARVLKRSLRRTLRNKRRR